MKILTHPLPVALLAQICAITIYWIRVRKRRAIGPLGWPMAVVSVAVLFLTILSVPVVGELLQDSLSVRPAADMTPDYVVVLSGGSEEGVSPDLDVLSSETTKRVLSGVRYWNTHRSARMVMTGAGPGRNPGRETELMAEVARCRGVPSASIIREPTAMSTHEHPLRLRALPGFQPTTRLVIVTSAWHERRAVAEFRRYFAVVAPQSVPPARHRILSNWIPDARGLVHSTDAIQEWVAIIWYRVLALFESAPVGG